MRVELNVVVPHAWHNVRNIRERVSQALGESDPGLRSAAVMTASELTENAIKYGEDVIAAPSVAFSLTADDDGVRIQVSNGCLSTDGMRQLQERIDAVTNAPDKAALYMARLEELLANPEESGKLGIYRIAFEGKFDLACSYENQVVTVVATRSYR